MKTNRKTNRKQMRKEAPKSGARPLNALRVFFSSFFFSVFRLNSIRTRLLLAYGIIILVAFAAISFVAGTQIASAARVDYERSLINVAHLLSEQSDYMDESDTLVVRNLTPNDAGVMEIIPGESQDTDRIISLVRINLRYNSARDYLRDRPELEAAFSGRSIVVERYDPATQMPMLYTAVGLILPPTSPEEGVSMYAVPAPTEVAPTEATPTKPTSSASAAVTTDAIPPVWAQVASPDESAGWTDRFDDLWSQNTDLDSPLMVVPAIELNQTTDVPFIAPRVAYILRVSVPSTDLDTLIARRWGLLLLLFGLVMIVALVATLWVSRTITKPLYALRESAIQLAKGDFTHRVAEVGQDEIGEVAQAFNEMAQQVESMINEQRAFASNTSHELRTPLTTIRLRSEALRYEALDEDMNQQYITEIDDEARRLGTLIEDLTLLSRFDAGRSELGRNEIDMRRFAGSMLQQFQQQARAKQITLFTEATDEPIILYASLNHLTVVFRNVLDNALKYTPEGGSVTWSISSGVEGVTSILEDTGLGIESENLPHLFERFFRVDKARSRQVPGTGLGLALVQSIVSAYGGSISIESEGLHHGTTVTIFWPYGEACEQAEIT
ncbi:HAMP domain-containing protein [Phototrophicus methaneseepsis]|uniref:histidine kinase n=1 Tax=Phototrophicus methaneseepsis TaxID=2710758 RepID=A0A7S8EBN0_9CHLR|nr:ATP-binding protein [Phototrophicus methaneseepsis]QPC84003.1 HAMP domain-containing protein [Phototrophicus methaneseepsis]